MSSAFMTAVFEAWSKPDSWDGGGAILAEAEQAFTEFGKIALKAKAGTLSVADAQAFDNVAKYFANCMAKIAAKVSAINIPAVTPDEIRLRGYILNFAQETQKLSQSAGYMLDEVLAGSPHNEAARLSANGALMLKVGGVILNVTQVGFAYYFDGVDEGAKKLIGALAGLSVGGVGAWLGTGVVTLGAEALGLVAGTFALTTGAIIGAAGAGFLFGKFAEESYGYVIRPTLDQMFATGGEAWTAADTFYGNSLKAIGKFDGTWMQAETLAEVAAADKAAVTALIAGMTQASVTEALYNDLVKLFEVDFQDEQLIARDTLISTLFAFAKENGYPSERITVSDDESTVTLTLLSFPTIAQVTLRENIANLLSEEDRVGLSLTTPYRIIIALEAADITGNEKDELIIGSTEDDTIDGAAGDDVIVAGDGADSLDGDAGIDVLFGGDDDDTLDGGANGDYLYGGDGDDKYDLATGELTDVIRDTDGNGTVWVDDTQLTGGKQLADNYWVSDDKEWGYLLTATGDLVISRGSNPDRIVIRDWQSTAGNLLGITLQDVPAAAPPPAPAGSNLVEGTDEADTLQGSTGADVIRAYGGKDWIDVYTGGDGGNDWIDGGTGMDLINATSGNDELFGGAGRDVILGGAGNDQVWAAGRTTFDDVEEQTEGAADSEADLLTGSLGDDTIHGDAGNDALFGGSGKDLIAGGAGDDNIFGDLAAGNIYRDLWALQREETTDEEGNIDRSIEFISVQFAHVADPGDDLIFAGAGNDWVSANEGDDYVEGGTGNDLLFGMAGADILDGGEGDDSLAGDGTYSDETSLDHTPLAQHGDDILYGGVGNDELLGGAGNDYLDGEDGDDLVAGDPGDDEVFGGAGNDTLQGDAVYWDGELHGDDYLDGEAGDDQLFGEGGNDTLFGDVGNDVLVGDESALALDGEYHGADYLDGEGGNDTLFGGGGGDTLLGSDGNDDLSGDDGSLALDEHGDDDLDGGSGNDSVKGQGGNDTLWGGTGNDILDGGAGNDVLDGEEGDDQLQGGDGNDLLIGSGADSLWGEAGNDTLVGSEEINSLAGGDGDDVITAGSGDDLALGDAGDDTVYGEAGNDQLQGNDGNDFVFDDEGNDLLYGQAGDDLLESGAGNDQLQGGDGSDELFAGDANDLLWGDGGNDYLEGEAGSDVLRGGDGDDTLVGGTGFDKLYGGAGNDTYIFNVGDTSVGAELGEIADDLDGVNNFKINGAASIGSITTKMIQFVFPSGSYPGDYYVNTLAVQTGQNTIAIRGLLQGNVGTVEVGGTTYTASQFYGKTYAMQVTAHYVGINATLQGGKLGDALTSEGGNATLTGGMGDDTMNGSGGQNTYRYELGDGVDTISDTSAANKPGSTLSFLPGISASDIRLSTNAAGTALIVGFAGAAGAVQIMGFNANNAMQATRVGRIVFSDGTVLTHAELLARGFDVVGTSADETVRGTNLDDRITGGAGNDTLTGGAGNDTFIFKNGDGFDVVADGDAAAGTGDRLLFGAGIATTDVRAVRTGDDVTFLLASDQVTLRNYFGTGVDAVEQVEFADGTKWGMGEVLAAVTTSSGDAVLIGDEGDNNMYGLGGNDRLEGRGGADTLNGGGGNDTLVGGSSGDIMYGGAGSDTYVVGLASDYDNVDESNGGDLTGIDTLQFTEGLGLGNLTVYSWENDVYFYGYQNDREIRVRVLNQYASDGPQGQIERFEFADGTVLTSAEMKIWMLESRNQGFGTSDDMAGTIGNDGKNGMGGNDTMRGAEGNDTLYGDVGNDGLWGDAGNDSLIGGDGNDTLDGGAGWDRLDGGAGNDTYSFGLGRGNEIVMGDASGVDTVKLAAGITTANVTLHRVSSPPAADITYKGDSLVIQLNGGSDQLWVANYFDAAAQGYVETITFDGGTVWDYAAVTSRLATQGGAVNTASGTTKANTFTIDHWNDVISDPSLSDIDTATSSVSYRLPDTVNNLTLTGTLNLFAIGGGASDTLKGNAGDNWFDFMQGLGSDSMLGGKGNDVYVVKGKDQAINGNISSTYMGGASITELLGEGVDTLMSGFWSATLPDNVENLVLIAPNAWTLYNYSYDASQNDLSHKLIGNALNNVLDSTAYEQGTPGTRWYFIRSEPDLSSIAEFRLDGGFGADTMIGGYLNDTYVIDNAADVVDERGTGSIDTVETKFETSLLTQFSGIESITLVGSDAVNATGNAGDNRLDGSRNAAVNHLTGGAGNDTYVVGSGDFVHEQAGEGNDSVVVASSTAATVLLASYANTENLRLQRNAGNLNAVGDDAANQLIGSVGANRLEGAGGDDSMHDQYYGDLAAGSYTFPTADSDTLLGGDGSDTLTTYGGVDVLEGGQGDDSLNVFYKDRSVTVRLGLGDGHDTLVQTQSSNVAAAVVVELKAGVGPLDLQLQRSGGALTITLTDGTSLALPGSAPVSLQFADGMFLGPVQVEAMVGRTDFSTATTGDDMIFGALGADTISALGGNDSVFSVAGADLVDGGAGNDALFGGQDADTLVGGTGNDNLAGGTGADVYRLSRGFGEDLIDDNLVGGASHAADDGAADAIELDSTLATTDVAVYRQVTGTTSSGLVLAVVATGDRAFIQNAYAVGGAGAVETVRFASGTQWDLAMLKTKISGVVGYDTNDTFTAPVVASRLEGRGGNDSMTGSTGADTLDGGTGNDTMTGLAGDDTYWVDSLADAVVEASSGGVDTVVASVNNYVLAVQVERLQLAAGSQALTATGNTLANTITGNAGNNWLDGGTGVDNMAGGAGDDTYVVEIAGETITEALNEGADTVRSAVTFTLGNNVENLVLTGSATKLSAIGNDGHNVLVGNGVANTLTGNGGNDRLDGGAGADGMTGGAGNDTFVVDSTSDTTVESAGGGIDTIETGITLASLAAEVERLILTGSNAVNGTGNTLNNWLAGNGGANTLSGNAGADALLGGAGNDVLQDTAGNGALDGGLGADTLTVGAGNDFLAGGAGNDTLTLGAGSDVIAFNKGDGADTVNAPVSGAGLGENNDTISLGGIRLAEMTLSREGSDLVLKVAGTADAVRLKDWYLAAGDQTVAKLQVVIDSSADYAPGGADALRSARVDVFNFKQLVAAYDAARVSNPSLVNWAASDANLQSALLSSSDTLAVGGNFAYHYAREGTVGNVAYDALPQQLASVGFGSTAQVIADFAALQGAPAGVSMAAQEMAEWEQTAAVELTGRSVSGIYEGWVTAGA